MAGKWDKPQILFSALPNIQYVRHYHLCPGAKWFIIVSEPQNGLGKGAEFRMGPEALACDCLLPEGQNAAPCVHWVCWKAAGFICPSS